MPTPMSRDYLSPRNISYSAAEVTWAASNYLRNSLLDGFTTIPEAGGADYPIARLLRRRRRRPDSSIREKR